MSCIRVGIFGGTFNPVHNGHLHLCTLFLSSGLIDEIWVLPVKDPPHKSINGVELFYHRYEMAQIAFRNMQHVKVLDLEESLEYPNYTLNTLSYLSSKFPDNSFVLCIGGDSLLHFKSWHRYKEILAISSLLVARRDNYPTDTLDSELLAKTTFVRGELTFESSTKIRSDLVNHRNSNEIPSDVLQYIIENELYL